MAKKKTPAKKAPAKKAAPKAALPKFVPFKPPTTPPSGTYDPTLDAQERAAGRGLADLLMDTEKAQGRTDSDYITQREDVERQRGQTLADMLLGRTRTLEDLNTQRADTDLSYQRLGQNQTESARQAGVARGGALLQAAEKRGVNMGRDMGRIQQSQDRYEQDYNQNVQRTNEATDRSLGQLALGQQRWNEDSGIGGTAIQRAQRENTFFGQDLSQARFYQAKGTGYEPPVAPTGILREGGRVIDQTQRKDEQGLAYRLLQGRDNKLKRQYADRFAPVSERDRRGFAFRQRQAKKK